MQSADADQATGKPVRELLITVAAPLLAVATALIYGVLVLAYSEFHAELGLRPADAGVEYGPGLGGAAGIVVLIGGSSAVLTAVGAAVWWAAISRPTARGVGLASAVTAFILSVCVAFFLVNGANRRADAVKSGQPLEPLRILGLEMLGIRADLADVEVVRPAKAEVATATTDSQILEGIDKRQDDENPLFYLGRSASSFVLYDSEHQRVLHVPTAVAVVQAHNCETRRRDARCVEVLDRD